MRALAFILLFLAGPAWAQVRSVEVRVPRAFGYFVGDLVEVRVDIATEPGFTVQRAALPQPGPVTYWLDLRAVAVEETPGRVRLRLTYQTFYAALDARPMPVPGFTVTLAADTSGGLTTAKAEIPGWSLGMSPLREVQPEKRDDPADYLRPDGRSATLDPAPDLRNALVAFALALAALAALAYDRAWFGRRPGRPFARADRAIRRLPRDGDEGYRAALRLVHRGLDETDGRRVLADDLPGFLARHPAFRAEEAALVRFFSASRRAFFGGQGHAAREAWPWPDLTAGLSRLAVAERAG